VFQPLDSIATSNVVRLQDRALPGAKVYCLAHVGVVIRMQVGDYYQDGKRWCLRLYEKGGTIENAQAIAAHASPRTTKLYDRTSDEIILDEVERIRI
jgi:hypothetical protein